MKWQEMCSLQPFYEDFMALVYIDGDGSAKLSTDVNGITQFISSVKPIQIIGTGEKILSHTFKYQYQFICSENRNYVMKIVKEHIWDSFKSVGTIVIVGVDPKFVINFSNQFFAERRPKTRNVDSTFTKARKN